MRKRIGMNRLYSSDLRIDIDSNEVTGITYLEEPDGVFYPMDKINKEEQYVPGLIWLDSKRPRTYTDLLRRQMEVGEATEESDEEMNSTSENN